MTLPSHTSLFTSTYPSYHGVRDNGRSSAGPGLTTLAEVLREQGFATGAFIASYVLDRRFGLAQGFDTYDDELHGASTSVGAMGRERPGGEVVERTITWLRDRNRETRFFCWVHLFDPHSEHRAPPPYDARHAGRPYDGEIAYSDENVGRLLGALDELGLERSTLVVFASDHGEAFGEHGEQGHAIFVYDTTLLVPLVLRWPDVLPSGRVAQGQVSLVDLAPTILDVLGLDPLPGSQGRSLLGACFEDPPGDAEPVYAESFHGSLRFGWAPLQSVRTDRWKLIRAPRPELYDLKNDPGETTNVIDDHPDVARQMEAWLDAIALESAPAAAAPAAVTLDDEARANLEALGYLGGESLASADDVGADPKDRIAAIVEYQRSKQLMAQGLNEEARAILDELVRQSPDSAEMHSRLGLASARLADWERAEASLSRALALDPTSGETLVNLAAVHMAVDDLDRARPLLEQALRLDPDDAMALLNLGALELRLGRIEQGVAHHRRFLELAPDDPRADKVRRSVESLQGQLDEP
jgi:arylsulfatase A-like enzyme